MKQQVSNLKERHIIQWLSRPARRGGGVWSKQIEYDQGDKNKTNQKTNEKGQVFLRRKGYSMIDGVISGKVM